MGNDENLDFSEEKGGRSQEKRTDLSQMQVWSEYVRSKTEILDRYYNINWFMPQYLHKKTFYSKNDVKLLSFWRDNIIRLFYLLEPHETKLKEIVPFTDEQLQDINFLQTLTKEIFNLENMKKLTTYGMHEQEPIRVYKEENYHFFD